MTVFALRVPDKCRTMLSCGGFDKARSKVEALLRMDIVDLQGMK